MKNNFFILMWSAALLSLGCSVGETEEFETFPVVEKPTDSVPQFAIAPTFPGDLAGWGDFDRVFGTYKIVKDAGAEIAHFAIEWGGSETDRNEIDWGELELHIGIIEHLKLKSSMVLKIVDTDDLGIYPEDLREGNPFGKNVVARFSSFVEQILDKHHGKIDYLWIGNEVDVYFRDNRGQISGFNKLFSDVYAKLKPRYPDIKFGVISTYHDAKSSGSLDIIKRFNKADVLGFTLYPQFLSDDPGSLSKYVGEIADLASSVNKPFAITETSWSSAQFAGSEERQVEFTRELFSAYRNYKDKNMEFITLFGVFDYPLGLIESSRGHMAGLEQIETWLLTLMLIDNSGKPKDAWPVFLEGMRNAR